MSKGRVWFTLFISSLVAATATASCGGGSVTVVAAGGSPPGTAPGSGAGATGLGGGAVGAAAASDSGGSDATGGASAIGRAGSTGLPGSLGRSGASGLPAFPGSGGSAGVGTLGAMCASNLDCSSALICITPDSAAFASGGPSLGLCTRPCTTDASCAALVLGAGCVNFGTPTAPKAYCLEGCTQGGDVSSFDSKCHGRPDVACTDLSSTSTPEPFCVPLCRADLECGLGLFCNRKSGLCSATQSTGDPVGTACDPASTVSTCQGICVGFSATAGRCAEVCSGLSPCMFGGPSGDVPGGLCSGALSQNFGPLDEGFCEPNCQCTADCEFPDHVCRAWPTAEASFKQALGADGMCYPSVLDSVELLCAN